MPLRIIIVGAGIVGLSVAIPLGNAGHEVHIYEKSAFSNEVGAAFHFGPHAHKILKAWGLDIASLRPNICRTWRTLDWDAKPKAPPKFILSEKQKKLGVTDDEIMIHRVDAHACLREHALRNANVHLHLSSALESVDAASGSITLVDGSVHSGDVVIGADGVHSKTVLAVAGQDCVPKRLGINMYRMTASVPNLRQDPDIKELLNRLDSDESHLAVFEKVIPGKKPGGRFIVLYPCRGGTLMNLATLQPAAIEQVKLTSEWNHPGKIEDVLNLLSDWPDVWKRMLSMGEDIKHWAVVSRACAPAFVKDKLVLIGDAAHPTQPTHGAGAGMGISDAAVLGVLLDETASPENLARRLELYNKLRFEPAVTVKCASEMLGPWGPETTAKQEKLLCGFVPNGKIPKDVEAYMWTRDVVAEAKKELAELNENSKFSGS